MKLTPKPLPKDKKPSQESSSTKHDAKDLFTTPQKKVLKETITGVEFTRHDEHGQEVSTAAKKWKERQHSTKSSIGIFAPDNLTDFENQELYLLGQTFAQMIWLKFSSLHPAFREGFAQGEGVLQEMDGRKPKDFDGVVLYCWTTENTAPLGTKHTKIVTINSPVHLKRFTTEAITELYRRGILV